MRYFYKKSTFPKPEYGEIYLCEHPVYRRCTLFRIGGKGLAVIQQCYDPETRRTWWSEIDRELTGELYLHPGFKDFFDARGGEAADGLFPTVSLRQIMWALRMKPLPKARWETVFDRRDI